MLRDLAQDGGGEEAARWWTTSRRLRALGLSAWTEDEVTHGLVRLTLK